MGYERDEPQLYLTIDLAVEFTDKSLESLSRSARGLEKLPRSERCKALSLESSTRTDFRIVKPWTAEPRG